MYMRSRSRKGSRNLFCIALSAPEILSSVLPDGFALPTASDSFLSIRGTSSRGCAEDPESLLLPARQRGPEWMMAQAVQMTNSVHFASFSRKSQKPSIADLAAFNCFSPSLCFGKPDLELPGMYSCQITFYMDLWTQVRSKLLPNITQLPHHTRQ